MAPSRLLFVAAITLAFCLAADGHAPAPFPRKERRAELPVGRWTVTFDNGVVQSCEVGPGGAARVVEPQRNSAGKATVKRGAVLIVCEDDRVERWTRAEGRMAVEHWFPASAFPDGKPVRGVARRAR